MLRDYFQKSFTFIIIIILLVISIDLSIQEKIVIKSENSLSRNSNNQIRINNDLEMKNITEKNKWPGDGTSLNPYIFSDLEINGNGQGFCIYIGNTSSYFIIQNSHFYDALGNNGPFYHNAGVIFYNCTNGTIRNVYSINNYYGIHIDESNNLLIENNTCSLSKWDGIVIRSSNNNIIKNNFYGNNNRSGILVDGSHNNKFYNNRMYACGIILQRTKDSFITQEIPITNTINDKPIYFYKNKDMENASVPTDAGQVILANITNMKIENLIVNDGSVGILVGYSKNIYIANNNCNRNNEDGILLDQTHNSIIENNTCIENRNGIFLDISRNNIISNNTFSINFDYGIFIYSADHTEIFFNNLSWNGGYGVYLGPGRNNVHHNNFFFNNKNGIQSIDLNKFNRWNTTDEGNYWSDYEQRYPEAQHDNHVWNTPYVHDTYPNVYEYYGRDYYPLFKPYSIPPIGYIKILYPANNSNVKLSSLINISGVSVGLDLDSLVYIKLANRTQYIAINPNGSWSDQIMAPDYPGYYQITAKYGNLEDIVFINVQKNDEETDNDTAKDTDNDGYPDHLEDMYNSDKNDPQSHPPDIDNDKIPDDIDNDRDGDGFPNEQDIYPDDPDNNPEDTDESKENNDDGKNSWVLIIIIAGIIIAFIIVFFSIYRRKTRQPEEIPEDSRIDWRTMRSKK